MTDTPKPPDLHDYSWPDQRCECHPRDSHHLCVNCSIRLPTPPYGHKTYLDWALRNLDTIPRHYARTELADLRHKAKAWDDIEADLPDLRSKAMLTDARFGNFTVEPIKEQRP